MTDNNKCKNTCHRTAPQPFSTPIVMASHSCYHRSFRLLQQSSTAQIMYASTARRNCNPWTAYHHAFTVYLCAFRGQTTNSYIQRCHGIVV